MYVYITSYIHKYKQLGVYVYVYIYIGTGTTICAYMR